LPDLGLAYSGILSVFRAGEQRELECDNNKLPQCEDLAKFNSHVISPSLSRKLYRPGLNHGFLVYGLGGPKILISHPFQGIRGDKYDLYNNSSEVISTLHNQGYYGRLLLFDYVPGLNFEIQGVPAWVLWFSIIAAHSDLVLFIKEYDQGFSQAQKQEIEFTPDRVQKKIVEIPHQDFIWTKESDQWGETRTTLVPLVRGESA
jgi:hypothetical protein